MSAPDHCVVLIHLGPQLPSYVHDALVQIRLFNACPVLLVAEAGALAEFALPQTLDVTPVDLASMPVGRRRTEFRAVSALDRGFRQGFWSHATERFFVLEDLMADRGLVNVVHLENDNLLYAHLPRILPVLERRYPGIAATFDNDQRCVPGFFYVRKIDALAALTAYIVEVHAQKLLEDPNDMMAIGAFRRIPRAPIDHLPIAPPGATLMSPSGIVPADPSDYWRNAAEFDSLFDAAAIGQYLGGVDPRNAPGRDTRGFVNESSFVRAPLYRFEFERDRAGRRVPFLVDGDRRWALNNLHVHSKNLKQFRSH